MAVVVARARIRIVPDGQQYLSKKTELVLADEFAGDPHKTPMQRCNDLIPFKPFADLTISADLHAAEPAEVIAGTVTMGGINHEVSGTGPRIWYFDKRWRLSTPEPTDHVPVSYELACGGRIIGDPDGDVDPRNPIGAGVIHMDYTPKTVERRAPQNWSQIAPLQPDPKVRPAPMGFGPIPPWWKARQQYTGTYDDAWLDHVHPRLPKDFDYQHYQVAHPDMILPSYLWPGMAVQTHGLRPGGRELSVQLPDLVPFAKYSFIDGREVEAMLHLDGMHLDLRAENPGYELTWRTWIETCPSIRFVDLNMDRSAKVKAMRLPSAGPNGLQSG